MITPYAGRYCMNCRTFQLTEAQVCPRCGLAMMSLFSRTSDSPDAEDLQTLEELLRPDPAASMIGQKLGGRYRVEAVRSGGMAKVFLVRDLIGEKLYAAKTIAPRYSQSTEIAESFLRETEVWLLLGRHPHVVQAHFSDIVDGQPFIFLEALPGTTLRDVLNGPLHLDIALDYARQICLGMTHAEAVLVYGNKAAVVHGDLKPDNILLADSQSKTRSDAEQTRGTTLKVSDFGLAQVIVANMSVGVARLARHGLGRDLYGEGFVGTPHYMAPEQFGSRLSPSVQSDIYSFGVMLYELLIGTPPFMGASFEELAQAHRSQAIPKLTALVPSLPEDLQAIVCKCLHKNPEWRFQSFSELLASLSSIGSHPRDAEAIFQPQTHSSAGHIELNLKGISLARVKRFEAALWYFRQVPRAPAHLNEANVHLALGRPLEALRSANRVLDETPNYDGAWNIKGLALKALGNLDFALESFERAVWLDSWSLDGTLNLADTLRLKGEYESSMRLLDFYLAEVPDDVDAIRCKELCLSSNKDWCYALKVRNGTDRPSGETNTGEELEEPLIICRTRFYLISPYSTVLMGREGRFMLKDL
jgi:serine/threonine protein kinase